MDGWRMEDGGWRHFEDDDGGFFVSFISIKQLYSRNSTDSPIGVFLEEKGLFVLLFIASESRARPSELWRAT
jgi:hypothetical protein